MLINNYPNYKDPTQPFEFQQPRNKALTQKSKTNQNFHKTPGATRTQQNFNRKQQNLQKSSTQQHRGADATPKPAGRVDTASSHTKSQSQFNNSSQNLHYSTIPQNYDDNEMVRSNQIEENWHFIQENKQNEEDQKRLEKKQQYYHKLKEDIQNLAKYKQWSEQVYASGPDAKDYRAIKIKLENLKKQEQHEQEQQELITEQLQQVENDNQTIQEQIQVNEQKLQNIKQENQKLKEQIQENNQKIQKCEQNIRNIKNNLPQQSIYYDEKNPNKKKKIKKSEWVPILNRQRDNISQIQKMLV